MNNALHNALLRVIESCKLLALALEKIEEELESLRDNEYESYDQLSEAEQDSSVGQQLAVSSERLSQCCAFVHTLVVATDTLTEKLKSIK